MSSPGSETDQPDEQEGGPDEQPDSTASRGRRADPDAPGNYVDDQDVDDVPEPNEPA